MPSNWYLSKIDRIRLIINLDNHISKLRTATNLTRYQLDRLHRLEIHREFLAEEHRHEQLGLAIKRAQDDLAQYWHDQRG